MFITKTIDLTPLHALTKRLKASDVGLKPEEIQELKKIVDVWKFDAVNLVAACDRLKRTLKGLGVRKKDRKRETEEEKEGWKVEDEYLDEVRNQNKKLSSNSDHKETGKYAPDHYLGDKSAGKKGAFLHQNPNFSHYNQHGDYLVQWVCNDLDGNAEKPKSHVARNQVQARDPHGPDHAVDDFNSHTKQDNWDERKDKDGEGMKNRGKPAVRDVEDGVAHESKGKKKPVEEGKRTEDEDEKGHRGEERKGHRLNYSHEGNRDLRMGKKKVDDHDEEEQDEIEHSKKQLRGGEKYRDGDAKHGYKVRKTKQKDEKQGLDGEDKTKTKNMRSYWEDSEEEDPWLDERDNKRSQRKSSKAESDSEKDEKGSARSRSPAQTDEASTLVGDDESDARLSTPEESSDDEGKHHTRRNMMESNRGEPKKNMKNESGGSGEGSHLEDDHVIHHENKKSRGEQKHPEPRKKYDSVADDDSSDGEKKREQVKTLKDKEKRSRSTREDEIRAELKAKNDEYKKTDGWKQARNRYLDAK